MSRPHTTPYPDFFGVAELLTEVPFSVQLTKL